MVGLVDHDNLELLLGRLVDLLCLRYLFEEVLDDHSVVVSDIGWCNFEMVDRGDDVELELPVAACLEDTCIDLDLFHAGSVQLLQSRDNSCLFAGTGWSIDEKVGEVTALGLRVLGVREGTFAKVVPEPLTSERNRSDRSS